MGVYDQAARYAAQIEPAFVMARLRREIGLDLAFRRWLPTRSLPLPGGPDRDADLVAIADDPTDAYRPWLLIFEFQAQDDTEKPSVAQLEAMVFLCHARDTDRAGGRFLPLPVFVYLKPEPPESSVVVRTPTGRGFSGDPAAWAIANDSAAETLARVESGEVSWGAMFWIALMAGADNDDVIDRWRQVLDEKVPEKSRGDVVYIALVFAELVGRRRAWNRVKEGITMSESAVVNEFIQEGEMRGLRDALVRIVRGRFPGILTPDVERAIADQPSLEMLRDWLDAAGTSENGEDFLAVLRR